MRIALLHPTYWPEVERGSERWVHDLGVTLVRRGHEVTVLSTHPGASSVEREDGLRVVRSRRLPQPPTLGLHEDWLGNVPTYAWHLLRGDFDVAHAFHLAPAWAAVQARRAGGPPVAFNFQGMPTREHLVSRRYRLEMMQSVAASGAAACVLSEAAATLFRRYLLREPEILPGGVLLEDFAVDEPRADPPTLACAASVGDPRKRGSLMFEAFNHLRERRPDVCLEVTRTPDPHMSPYSFELPDGASWIEPASTDALARAYSRASASVLAARDEPFGLVLVESLAAGTPVAAARSGSCPEIIDSPRVGALFDGEDPAALAEAMEIALTLGGRKETRDACRERAREYDWWRVVERYEAVYSRLVAAPAGVASG
jgi:glycosyltransferase involved in cell wall biosynthesis